MSKTGCEQATVTSDVGGIDCGSVCVAPYDHGTWVTLTAEPAEGYTFAGSLGEGCASGTVLMDQAGSCTAAFEEVPGARPASRTPAICRAGSGTR